MLGMMMNTPLLVSSILRHAATYHGGTEVVSKTIEGPIHRYGYADALARAKRILSLAETALRQSAPHWRRDNAALVREEGRVGQVQDLDAGDQLKIAHHLCSVLRRARIAGDVDDDGAATRGLHVHAAQAHALVCELGGNLGRGLGARGCLDAHDHRVRRAEGIIVSSSWTR